MQSTKFGSTKIVVMQGDITKQEVDAIVNAANARLVGGGGVDGAIHRAGGPTIMVVCDKIRANTGGCPAGQAVITHAGELHAKHVIHAVGPIWGEQSEERSDELLAHAYRNSLLLAHENGDKTIAFPSISTGVYGFPIERAAPIVLKTVHDFVQETPFDEIRFVLFSEHDLAVYERELEKMKADES